MLNKRVAPFGTVLKMDTSSSTSYKPNYILLQATNLKSVPAVPPMIRVRLEP